MSVNQSFQVQFNTIIDWYKSEITFRQPMKCVSITPYNEVYLYNFYQMIESLRSLIIQHQQHLCSPEARVCSPAARSQLNEVVDTVVKEIPILASHKDEILERLTEAIDRDDIYLTDILSREKLTELTDKFGIHDCVILTSICSDFDYGRAYLYINELDLALRSCLGESTTKNDVENYITIATDILNHAHSIIHVDHKKVVTEWGQAYIQQLFKLYREALTSDNYHIGQLSALHIRD